MTWQDVRNDVKCNRIAIAVFFVLMLLDSIVIHGLARDRIKTEPGVYSMVRDIRMEIQSIEDHLGIDCAWNANETPAIHQCDKGNREGDIFVIRELKKQLDDHISSIHYGH